MSATDRINSSMYGLYLQDPKFMEELGEVKTYYEFYEGRPYRPLDDLSIGGGQLWATKERDYRPTREVRNLVKKLMNKQTRFMTSKPPTILLSSVDGNVSKEQLDAKRGCLEQILQQGKFWNKFSKGFMDCCIGKRVLLACMFDTNDLKNGKAITDTKIRFRFYTMPEFTYEFDPNDPDTLTAVRIAYQDKSTAGLVPKEQRWHKYTYRMKDENDNYFATCQAKYEIVDGTNATAFLEYKVPVDNNGNEPEVKSEYVELVQEWDTGLSCIPCKVIFNDGLTGDIRGNSDIKDLMDMANDYNRTVSDYRDALRFRMFEQPVFIDADSRSIAGIKIAPNALIDLKSDPALGDGTNAVSTAKAEMLSGKFNFQVAVDSYLLGLKKDMFEAMDQPHPDSLINLPSAKALKMMYYDLIIRCEDKWAEWEEALLWLVDLIEECVIKFHLYPDMAEIKSMSIPTVTKLQHNYPIPDDEDIAKQVAIAEVQANVRSKHSYVEQFGYVEDADAEMNAILDEISSFNEVNNAMMGLDMTKTIQEGEKPTKRLARDEDKKVKSEKKDK